MDVNNQGLNLPSNLQNLDVRNELLSKEVGSGASCAYSLRDLTGSNKKVVRVRRTPHDTTANTIDDERIFGGQEVQAGYVEDWVNGKLENTLPGDIATARSLHSLRKIRSGYNGNALRIRRSSDNVEVDVAFDSDGKVSASSAITNVAEQGGESGQTTATTLGEFINHSGDFGDFRVDSEWSDNLLAFSSVGKTSFSVEAKSLSGFNSTDTVRVSAPITKVIAEPQASVTKFKTTFTIDSISGEGNGNATDGALYVKGANTANGNGSWNLHNSPDGTGGDETFKFTSTGTYTVEGYGEDETDAFNLAFKTFSFIIYSGTKVSVSNVSMEVLNDCGVHTWYNQSGASTGATQTTAQRQPKIATNGTLLDHILFEGSGTVTTPASTDQYLVDTSIDFDDALTLGCVSDRLSTTGAGMYPVSVSRQSAVNRFFGIQEATSQSVFITRNSTSVTHSVNNTSELKRFTIGRVGSNSETDAEISIFGRAFGNNNGSDWGNIVATSNQNSFVIGAMGLANDTGGIATGTATFQGKVYETFAYQTDEKDELFKIASNVNNYYGLYNDANDLEGTEFTGSTGTYTNNSKDGFTFSGTSTQSFVGIELKESVPVGETVYISFNCSHNAFSETTLVGLRASTVTGTNASTSYSTPQHGFAVASLTSTDANAKFVTFQIRQDSPTVTVSDFKVSRIARDGVVETLYDQSGNGNNATQSSAVKQPYVVQNGGQCKMTNGNPAVMGARYAGDKIQFLEMDTGISDPYTMFSSMYTTRSFSLLFGGSNTGSTPRLLVNTNGLGPSLNATDDMGTTSANNKVDSVVTLFSAENGGTAVLRQNGTQIDSLTRADDEIRPMKFLFRHQNNNQNKGIFFDSFIVYGSDKTSDFTEIEDQLKLENNIS